MIGERIKCQAPDCDVEFVKRTHNQIYHNGECTQKAMSIKSMEKYYARKAQRLGYTRFCNVCTETQLSRYNPDATCNSCMQKKEIERNNSVNSILESVSFA